MYICVCMYRGIDNIYIYIYIDPAILVTWISVVQLRGLSQVKRLASFLGLAKPKQVRSA